MKSITSAARKGSVTSLLLLGLLLLLSQFASADPTTVNALPEASRITTDALLKIHDVIAHGNLADDGFFAKTIGLTMDRDAKSVAPYSFNPCGLGTASAIPTSVRRFTYSDTPPFLDSKKNGRAPCSLKYLEHLDQGKVSQAMVQLDLDTSQACITSGDLVKTFPAAKLDDRFKSWNFVYEYSGDGDLEATFFSSLDKTSSECVSTIYLMQKFK